MSCQMPTTYMAVSPLLLGLRWLRIEFSLSAAISLKMQVHFCESESKSVSYTCLLIQLKPRCRGNWHTRLTYRVFYHVTIHGINNVIFILYILYTYHMVMTPLLSYGLLFQANDLPVKCCPFFTLCTESFLLG